MNIVNASVGLFVAAVKNVVAAELGFTDAKAGAARKEWVLSQLHAYIDGLAGLKVLGFDLRPYLVEGLDKLIEMALDYAKAYLGK